MRGDRNRYRDVNKPRKYRIDPTCKGKRRFVDEISARAVGAVSIAELQNTKRLWCYHCKHCGGWHLTSSSQGARWLITEEDPVAGATT